MREATIARLAAEWAHRRGAAEADTIIAALMTLREMAVRDFLRTRLEPELMERVEREIGPQIVPPLGE